MAERNTFARDRLVSQITELIEELRPVLDDIESAMGYLDQARNQSYTSPMDEVRAVLMIARRRIQIDTKTHTDKAFNLAGVANMIHKGEVDGNQD